MDAAKTQIRHWRITAGHVFSVWMLVTLINLFYFDSLSVSSEQDILTKELFIVLSVCTIGGLTVLLIYPLKFYIYSVIFCFWGLAYVVEGRDISGLLLYGLGVGFAYKQGFFLTRRNPKWLVVLLMGIGAVGTQYRYGLPILTNTILQCVILCIFVRLGYILLLPKLQYFQDALWSYDHKESYTEPGQDVALPFPQDIQEQDKELLTRIQYGDKYEHIAADMNISVPSLKRRTKDLFKQLHVPNREIFLARYGKIAADTVKASDSISLG